MAETTRVILDEDYMLLLWKHDDEPNRICDIFWLKHSHRYGRTYSRTYLTSKLASMHKCCAYGWMSIVQTVSTDCLRLHTLSFIYFIYLVYLINLTYFTPNCCTCDLAHDSYTIFTSPSRHT